MVTLQDPTTAPVAALRTDRPYRRAVGISVAVLVLAELALRLCAPLLPPPQVWPYPEVQSKAVEMSTLGRRGGAGTVFVGSSIVDVGLDPAAFDALGPLTRPAYNAGLLSGSLGEVRVWTEDFVVPALHPSTVVIGVSPRELNGADSTLAGIDNAFSASAEVRRVSGRETPVMVADRLLRRFSYLFRYRSILRQPHQLWQSPNHPASLVDITDRGMETTMLSRSHRPLTPLVIQQFSPLQAYRFGSDRLSILTDLVGRLRAAGIRVVVLDMPTSEDTLALLPRHETDYADYNERVRTAVSGAGGEYIAAGVWPVEQFVDPVHVNGSGAARLTHLLHDRLSR